MKKLQSVVNQITSNKKLNLWRDTELKKNATDIYLSFILNFKQYKNANIANFLYFTHILFDVKSTIRIILSLFH